MQTIDPTVFIARGSIVLGAVTIGADSGIWYNAVVRGDAAPIAIGERTNVQDCAVLHVDEGFPVTIGSGVTIGHGAVVHGCEVGDNTMIGMGAILMNGAKIGKDCLIGAGALIPQGMEVPDGHLAFGNPAKVRRALTEEEIAENRENAELYVRHAKESLETQGPCC